MSFRVLRVWAAALLLAVLSSSASPLWAQVRFAPLSAPAGTPRTPLDELLDRGLSLESQLRWGEALSLYEEALHEYPSDRQLESRFQQSKIHYDLGRRYGDHSYRTALATLSLREVLDLYSEVLVKIEANYVDQPDWQVLVEQGARTIDVALTDASFSGNLEGVAADGIEPFRNEMYRLIGTRRAASRGDARDAAAAVGNLVETRLKASPTPFVFEFICGATQSLDDYSSYLTADQLNDTYSQIDGNFVGLGIELKASENALEILRVIPGSPAQRSGIRPGDRIVAVDGQSTRDLDTDEAADRLQGPEGSLVEVSVVTPGSQPRRLRVRREHVEVPSIDNVKLLDPRYGVGYLRLTCFQKNTTRELDAALVRLHNQGMRSLIMDLRGNPGGLLTASVEVADKFVEKGVIVSTRGRNAQENYNYTANKQGTWRVPLIVLIDGDSASASEIFAGAIRDHRRGTLIGTRSYGKGSVQQIIPLSFARAGMRLTTAKFYSPNGLPYSKVGVEPDLLVEPDAATTTFVAGGAPAVENDPVVKRALGVARGQLARR